MLHTAYVIRGRNVNEVLPKALNYIRANGIAEDSRNGEVLVAPGPVISTYTRPMERVLFSEIRDANPFFHFFEALWMLAGRNDVAFLRQFNSRIHEFSDDGITFNGAYGFRWRNWEHGANVAPIDQLEHVIGQLQSAPETRRVVLSMFSVGDLLNRQSKDIPCNTHIYFDLRGGQLNMMVCNRSNDVIWGCYGANVVHFSFLQEYIASSVKVPVGVYHQLSYNLHIYKNVPRYHELMSPGFLTNNFYQEGAASPWPLMDGDKSRKEFDADLKFFLQWTENGAAVLKPKTPPVPYAHSIFPFVAEPMFKAWQAYKADRFKSAITEHCPNILGVDWRLDCVSWLRRRMEIRERQENRNDGVKA